MCDINEIFDFSKPLERKTISAGIINEYYKYKRENQSFENFQKDKILQRKEKIAKNKLHK